VAETTSARRALLATTRVDVEFAVAVSTEAGLVADPQSDKIWKIDL